MRIAFLTSEFVTEPVYAGGLGNYLFRTAAALRQRHECSPAVFVRSETDEHFVYEGIDVYRVSPCAPLWIKAADFLTRGRLRGALAQISVSRALWKKVLEEHEKRPFTIVQAASYAATNLCASKRIPSVVRISSFEPLWRKAYEKTLTPKQRLVEYLEKRAMRAANGIFSPSRLLAEKTGMALRLTVQVIEPAFIPDVTDLDNSMYEKLLKDRKYLLFFGTIGSMKGCLEIAEIIHPLLERHKDLYFAFAGAVSSDHSKETKRLIMEKAGNLDNRLMFFGPLKHEFLYPIIKKSLAVVLPSRIDNFPNACVEAMYLGQIVIGTKGASFEQLIEDGVSGFLCEPCNPASLLSALQRCISLTHDQRDAVSSRAKKRISELDPTIATDRLLSFYDAILRECRKKRT